jgi:hypothetical protein
MGLSGIFTGEHAKRSCSKKPHTRPLGEEPGEIEVYASAHSALVTTQGAPCSEAAEGRRQDKTVTGRVGH